MTTPAPPGPAPTDPADMHTRDMGQLATDGPDLSMYETPAARDVGVPPGGGMKEAQRTRPQFSPVAQPGMVPVIHWATVEEHERDTNGQPHPHHEQQTRGMVGRLHQRPRTTVQQQGGGRGRGGKGGGRRGRR